MNHSLHILAILFFFNISVHSQSVSDSNAVLNGWILDKWFVNPEKTIIDTNLENFQIHNIILRNYSSAATLSSNGSPYLSNLFFSRKQDDLLFLNSYSDYFSSYSTTVYFNTRKPFTQLDYMLSWPKTDREEYFKIFHTQNINDRLNFGLSAGVTTDKGQYRYINANSKSFSVFSSYTGRNYTIHLSLDLNRYYAGENGGVVDSSYNGDWQFTKEIETYFTGGSTSSSVPDVDVRNKVRYIDGMLSQNIKLFTIGQKTDSGNVSNNLAQPSVSYVVRYRKASKIYENKEEINNYYYDNIYSNIKATYDSIAEMRVTNTFQFDFKTKLRNKVTAGVFANVNHDYLKYTYYSLLDTALIDSSFFNRIDTTGLTPQERQLSENKYLKKGVTNYDTLYDINSNQSLYNIYVSGGIYGKFWTHFQSRFSASIYLAGYKAGETMLDGLMLTNINLFNRPYQLFLSGSLENRVPSYQLNNYYSNHYIWEKDFKAINKLFLSSKLSAPSNRFEIDLKYNVLRNYIFITDSMPESYNQPLSIWALAVQKEFVVWKFHSINKITYQVSENRSVVEVPALVVFNSTYIDQTWLFKLTGGKLRTMLGADVYYNTEMKATGYIPALSLFHIQNSSNMTGNYPYVDLWLSMKLKRTRFFLKYEHVNSSTRNLNHFLAQNYPSKSAAFKFGLSWTFYD
ncbi:MAG: hypothetical protein IPM71_10345 [Bacteroidota bacterium]|nr:MAG: hypothetical protein IPM71_10345 [Bacteroidota bacterium]